VRFRHARNNDGYTPLLGAKASGLREVAMRLVDAGADVNA